MARVTMFFGFVLVLIGVIGFVATGHAHPTALIPAAFGLILLLCGAAANTPNTKRQALWMHVAVTVSLLGFLGTAMAIFQLIEIFQGIVLPHPPAVEEKAAMSIVCLIFTAICVRSFIAARRARRASKA
jgi:hypothetical protein